MPFVKILAPLTGGPRDEIVLASALAAALPSGGHVAALFVRPDPALAMPLYGDGVSSAAMQEVIDSTKQASDAAAKSARALLDALSGATGVTLTASCEKHDAPSMSFAEATGSFADCVSQAARLSDLVVLAAPKNGERAGLVEAIEAVLLEARRPVLLASHAVAPDFCEKIAIGWNAGVECALAVSAALPYLARAKSVDILAVEQPGTPCARCDELGEYLSLHGVTSTVREVKAGARPVAEMLFEAASEAGAGLLVLGGYGHNRWREIFVSGVTRQAIAKAGLPLFLVH